VATEDSSSQSQRELEDLRLYYRVLLETLEPGVIAFDTLDVLLNENESALKLWGLPGMKLIGKNIEETPLATRCPELMARLHKSRKGGGNPSKFQCVLNSNDESRMLQITIRPLRAPEGIRVGTLVCARI
jgi:PAS domain S-box-containing protein